MANTHMLSLADRNKRLPLRGDMTGINMDYTPPDSQFTMRAYTEDAKTYTLNSAHKFFVKGQVANSFSFGGKAGLSVEFIYSISRGMWILVDDNLDSGTTTAPVADKVSNMTMTATIQAIVDRLIPPGGLLGQILGKTSNNNYALGWLNQTAGTGGGTAFMPEVLLTQNEAGEITPDKALGNSFRVLLNKKLIVKDPVGYGYGEEISITVRQPLDGATFPDPDFALSFGHPERQLPKFAAKPGAVNRIAAVYTEAIGDGHPALWQTEVTPKGSTVGYGAPSVIARNVQRALEYYVLRSPVMLGGMTDLQAGETLKIVRDGLGIEAYGAIEVANATVSGALPNGTRAELRTGKGVRAAFDRAVIAVATGGVNATIQDLILSGAREYGDNGIAAAHIAAGIDLKSNGSITVKNVRVYDCENGITSGNADTTGTLTLEDVEIDACGVGDEGLTHNMYTGRHPQAVSLLRVSSTNSKTAHNLKHRDGVVIHRQVLTRGAMRGRELNLPNGSNFLSEDSHYWKVQGTSQGNLIGIGEEGIESSRVHAYVFRNVHFQNDNISAGADITFIINFDHVPMYFYDCLFTGEIAKNLQGDPNGSSQYAGMVTVNGIRYWPDSPPVFITTPGVTPGPRVPVGHQPRAVIQIDG